MAKVQFGPFVATVTEQVWNCPENAHFEELLNLRNEAQQMKGHYIPGNPDNESAKHLAEQLDGVVLELEPELPAEDGLIY